MEMTNPARDGWDWPYILYIGRVLLGYTDEQVLAMTPRKFFSQLKAYEEITRMTHGVNASPKHRSSGAGFIDQIPGW